MEKRTKIIIGALVGIGALAGAAIGAVMLYKRKKVDIFDGDDDDVVYVLLDDETYEDGKKYKIKKAM